MQLNRSNIKACLFDIDKTLTTLKKEIRPETKQALLLLREAGVVTAACTGRHYATVQPVLLDLFPTLQVHVLASGGLLTQSNGKELVKHLHKKENVLSVIRIVEKFDGRFILQHKDKAYGNAKGIAQSMNWNLVGYPSIPAYSLEQIPCMEFPIIVVGSLPDEAYDELKQLPLNVMVMKNYNGQTYADIVPQGISKASGVREWCQLQNIEQNEVVAFGDGENDIEWMQEAGYAVAMGNAIDAVKEIADEVIETCDENGVARWTERMFA